jgi:hypothetical protein
MLIKFPLLTVGIFLLVMAIAPYVSIKGASQAFVQSSKEQTSSSEGFEESINLERGLVLYLANFVMDLSFPLYIGLKSQLVLVDVLKPPLS